MPNDSDRLTALETDHKNLKDAIAKQFINERVVTTFNIAAIESRVVSLEGEMVAFSKTTELMNENIQFLVNAERDRTTKENISKENQEKNFLTKFKDKLAEHLATLIAAGIIGFIIYLLASAKTIGVAS